MIPASNVSANLEYNLNHYSDNGVNNFIML